MHLNIRSKPFTTLALAGTLALASALTPLSADRIPAPSPTGEQSDKLELFSGKIEALDLEKKSLVIEKKTYLVVESTKLMDKEKELKLADLKVGTEVHGLAKKNAAGQLEATIIKLGPKPQDQPPKDR